MKRSAFSTPTSKRSTTPKRAKTSKSRALAPFRVPRQVGRITSGFPKQLRFQHRYVERITFQGTLGVYATYKFSCNGMYDPNVSGTGHQPYYFDQLSALYNHYTVTKSKIVADFFIVGGLTTVGVYIDDDTTSLPAVVTACEHPDSSYAYTSVSSASTSPTRVKKTWKSDKFFSGDALSDPTMQGTSGANPTEQSYYHLFIQETTAGTTVDAFVQVSITYDAVWSELIPITGS